MDNMCGSTGFNFLTFKSRWDHKTLCVMPLLREFTWCGRFLAKAVFSELPFWDDENFPFLEARSKFGRFPDSAGTGATCVSVGSWSPSCFRQN